MAREWALAGVPEDELQPPPPPKQPDTPRGKWENFWYHYKWVVLGAAAGLIVLTVLVVQMVTRDDADYWLPLVTDEPISEAQIAALQAELFAYGEDLDGDGKVEVKLENWYLNPKDGAALSQMVYVNSQNLSVHLAAGDRLFFMFQSTTYNDRIRNLLQGDAKFCAPIELEVEGLIEDGTCWDWYGSALQQSERMKGLPEHLYFGVRNATGTAGKQGETFEKEMALLRRFIEAQQTK